jgi:hypothetical protein
LLIYRNDIQRLFCVDCGFTPDVVVDGEQAQASNYNNTNAADNNNIWMIPMTQPRSEQSRQRLMAEGHQGWDQDM